MARRNKHKSVTSRMYRHFAAVTIVSTMVMAVFADGESRNAVAREVEQAGQPPVEQRPTTLVRKDNPSSGSFSTGDEFDSGYGQPIDGGSSDFGGTVPDDFAVVHGSGVPAGFTTYGVPTAEWEKLSEEQKKKLIARYRAEKAAASAPDRVKQVDSLLAASMARSGSGGEIE